jgi:hypothetical protein
VLVGISAANRRGSVGSPFLEHAQRSTRTPQQIAKPQCRGRKGGETPLVRDEPANLGVVVCDASSSTAANARACRTSLILIMCESSCTNMVARRCRRSLEDIPVRRSNSAPNFSRTRRPGAHGCRAQRRQLVLMPPVFDFERNLLQAPAIAIQRDCRLDEEQT